MPVALDIVRAWRGPRRLIRQKLDQGPNEGRALAVLMGACGLFFVAQWPPLSRAAQLDPSVPLDARLGGALLAVVFLVPLIAYGLAGLSHLLARAFGGRGSAAGARLALFWAMLAIAPAMLFQGLVSGILGQGPQATATGVVVLGLFLWLWFSMLAEAER
jgi:Yip1 domain